MRRQDVQDSALCVEQAKTGAKVRIEIVGPLAAILERLRGPVASVWLVHDQRGQRMTLSAMRRRFDTLTSIGRYAICVRRPPSASPPWT